MQVLHTKELSACKQFARTRQPFAGHRIPCRRRSIQCDAQSTLPTHNAGPNNAVEAFKPAGLGKRKDPQQPIQLAFIQQHSPLLSHESLYTCASQVPPLLVRTCEQEHCACCCLCTPGEAYNRINTITSGAILEQLSVNQCTTVVDYLFSNKAEVKGAWIVTVHMLAPNALAVQGLGLGPRELELVLIRYPETFKRHRTDIEQVVEFLQTDLQFHGDELRHVITKFPAVLGLHIKAHLRPHVIYLQSLGIAREQVSSSICLPRHLLAEPGHRQGAGEQQYLLTTSSTCRARASPGSRGQVNSKARVAPLNKEGSSDAMRVHPELPGDFKGHVVFRGSMGIVKGHGRNDVWSSGPSWPLSRSKGATVGLPTICSPVLKGVDRSCACTCNAHALHVGALPLCVVTTDDCLFHSASAIRHTEQVQLVTQWKCSVLHRTMQGWMGEQAGLASAMHSIDH
eukprot:1157900-Pelagomonas_calceolata.AAC.2